MQLHTYIKNKNRSKGQPEKPDCQQTTLCDIQINIKHCWELENRICRQIQDLRASFVNKREVAQRIFQKLHIYSLSTPKWSILSLFSLYGQRFPRYWPIFKIVIFGDGTSPLANVLEVAHILFLAKLIN